jgi:predicted transcriptional regulator YdeE
MIIETKIIEKPAEFYDQRYTKPDDPNAEIDLYFPIRAK